MCESSSFQVVGYSGYSGYLGYPGSMGYPGSLGNLSHSSYLCAHYCNLTSRLFHPTQGNAVNDANGNPMKAIGGWNDPAICTGLSNALKCVHFSVCTSKKPVCPWISSFVESSQKSVENDLFLPI